MREKDDLDLLLDSALATYADPGPESGLEDRVLAGLQAARASEERRRWFEMPRSWWLPGTIAVPVAVCLLVLWLSIGRTVHGPSTQQQLARQPDRSQKPSLTMKRTAQPSAVTGESARAKAHRNYAEVSARMKSCPVTKPACYVSGDVATAVPGPKLDVFPTPQPMSSEERALSVIAMQTPLPLRKALVEAQQDDSPIHIAAIHIPPLESPDQGQP
jgi:hypothetical protein